MSRDVLDRCLRLGFAAAGVVEARPTRWADELRAWLDAGSHGEMDYFLDELDVRLDPTKLLRDAKAFVVVADMYASRQDDGNSRLADDGGMPRGQIARYARGRDYHTVMKVRLHALADRLRIDYPGSEFRSFVDTAPVLERELAVASGLGWQAKNTMLIHPKLGSYLLLGGMATTLPLLPPAESSPTPDHCGTCTRCIDACPTRAITPYHVDGQKCISYLTIEHRSMIPGDLLGAMGDWIYGCDICQEVCPHNSPRPDADRLHAAAKPLQEYTPRASGFSLLEVLSWDTRGREQAIMGTAMKRASLEMMKRNALVAAGNSLARRPDAVLLGRVRELAGSVDEPELVRDTAREVLSRLVKER